MKGKSNFGKFLLLWTGEFISSIGVITGEGVGKGSALVIQISGVLLALIAGCIMTMKGIRALESEKS